MKFHHHLILFISLFGTPCFAQIETEMLKIPKEELVRTQKLCDYLIKGVSDDSVKAVRIYKWVTNNVAYDYKAIESGKPLKYQSPAMVLRSKTAVCQGYSVLTVDLLKKAGITAATVEGYTAGVLSDSLLISPDSDHEWVAFKVKGKWYLCDPTWDAGYIGRLPKLKNNPLKKEKMLAKRTKKETAASVKKKAKLKNRWAKADKSQEKKDEKLRGEYKGTVGFILEPSLNYFMQPSSEFVQSHLPSIPHFQLRDYPITMEDFYMKTKKWDTILNRKSDQKLDYTVFADNYAQLKTHKQWISTAVEGFKFNPESYGSMAIHHYNYIGIHLSKEILKMHEDIQLSDLDESLGELNVINDSVLVYCKFAQRTNKQSMADTKRIMGKEIKIFTSTDKAPISTLAKVLTAQEKNIDYLKKSQETIEKNLKLVAEKKAKVLSDSPNAETPLEFDESLVPVEFLKWKDSLFVRLAGIDSLRAAWDSVVHGEKILDDRFNSLQHAYELSFYNLQILNSSPTYYNDTVVHYDSLMTKEFDKLLVFHKTTYSQLVYPNDILRDYKLFEAQLKKGMSRLKAYSQSHVNFPYYEAYRYWNAIHFQLLSAMEDENYTSNEDRVQLLYMEKDLQQYYEIMKKNLDEEKEYKEKNIEHSKELLEKDTERMENMYKNLKTNAEKTSESLGKILGTK